MDKFLMSIRFNKQSPGDFGLTFKDGKFIRTADNTEWMPCELYDFGWGKENGFYKIPLGSFDELMSLVLCNSDEEDTYAAASIIMDKYPIELKEFLLNLMNQKINFKNKRQIKCQIKQLNRIFNLHRSINLTPIDSLTHAEIEKEFQDWKNIALYFKKYS